jgi:copper chaperone CopZ
MPLGLRVVLVAALFFLAQSAASAEFRRIEITIHGMDCATCAHAVRVAALKIDGVETVTISLQRAVADIRMREGNRVTIEQIRQMVRRSGFTPREASVTVIGSAVERGGAPAIAVSGIDQVLIVNVQRSDAAALKAVEDARRAAPSVESEITGTLEPAAGQPDQITVTTARARQAQQEEDRSEGSRLQLGKYALWSYHSPHAINSCSTPHRTHCGLRGRMPEKRSGL